MAVKTVTMMSCYIGSSGRVELKAHTSMKCRRSVHKNIASRLFDNQFTNRYKLPSTITCNVILKYEELKKSDNARTYKLAKKAPVVLASSVITIFI